MTPRTCIGSPSSFVSVFLAGAVLTALGGCPGDTGGGADATDVGGDTSAADTGGDVASDTSASDTAEADTADTTEVDTAVADTTEVDTAEDTTVADTTETDTTEADTVEDTTVTDTTVVVSCETDSCSGHGDCSVVDNAIHCACDDGYAGDACAGCQDTYQDANGDGTCELDCPYACGANTDCEVAAATGLATCTCATGYVDLAGAGVCTESICGDGYVDVAKGEECDPAEGAVDAFCVGCKVDCLVFDDNATDDNTTPIGPIEAVALLPDDNTTVDDNTTTRSYELTNGCYAEISGDLTWNQAADACEAMGAHLVELSDDLEAKQLTEAGLYRGWMNLQGTFASGPNSTWESGAAVETTPEFWFNLDQNTTLPDDNSSLSDPFCFYLMYPAWFAESCDVTNGTTLCERETCGDGIVSANEECDDGNHDDGDGCDSNCTLTGCGNAVVTAGEDCDDGDDIDTNACPNDCQLPDCALLIDTIAGSYEDTSGCYVEPADWADWATAVATCEDAGLKLVTAASRLDIERILGVVDHATWLDATDEVTDGTWLHSDGTEQTYLPFASSEPNNGTAENCLELGTSGYLNDLGCSTSRPYLCADVTCGDGIPDANEECDDGDATEGNGCDTNCRVSGCGNGVKDPSEECDDGNLEDGDGCSSTCHLPCGGATSGAWGAWSHDGYCYLTYPDAPVVPEDAEAACVALGIGAHLVTVTSDAENAFVFGIGGPGWALGYNDIAVEGSFVWFSGESSGYSAWGGSEPNNAGAGEDCTYYRGDGKWNDAACTNKAPYICELSEG